LDYSDYETLNVTEEVEKSMVRKWMMVLVVCVFAASLLGFSSCAKKQVKTDEAAKPAAVKQAAPAAPSDDADRQRRLAELEKQQKLQAEIRAFESENIFFDFDKSELKPAARTVLEKKAGWLRANSQYKLKIEGHCDERGTVEYNLALGERRAKAAMKYLSALGISADRMTTVSYGEERPADPGKNEAAWAKNRRDEFKLAK
jgi:peptidoglycan-associated lipoprotein